MKKPTPEQLEIHTCEEFLAKSEKERQRCVSECMKVLDCADLDPDLEPDLKLASTPESKERYAFLKIKKQTSTWYEGQHLYRKGANGITVFRIEALR